MIERELFSMIMLNKLLVETYERPVIGANSTDELLIKLEFVLSLNVFLCTHDMCVFRIKRI